MKRMLAGIVGVALIAGMAGQARASFLADTFNSIAGDKTVVSAKCEAGAVSVDYQGDDIWVKFEKNYDGTLSEYTPGVLHKKKGKEVRSAAKTVYFNPKLPIVIEQFTSAKGVEVQSRIFVISAAKHEMDISNLGDSFADTAERVCGKKMEKLDSKKGEWPVSLSVIAGCRTEFATDSGNLYEKDEEFRQAFKSIAGLSIDEKGLVHIADPEAAIRALLNPAAKATLDADVTGYFSSDRFTNAEYLADAATGTPATPRKSAPTTNKKSHKGL